MAMLAIVAWSLSVVDVAIILGPGNPPTLAVISWQWLTQGDADQQTKGALASLLLMPWMLFILQPAWQRIDSRLILIAQTLGWSRAKIFFYVKCPLMLRPVLIAFAVGFSVSIAQYMPTLWLGAGRFPTLTTEAVALSSGGSNGILAAQALWQLLLPLIIFALTALVAKWVGYVRQGIR